MPDDTPPIPRRKLQAQHWIICGGAILIAIAAYYVFGPNPPIQVSKQTTYITSPLLPDGLPDYEGFILQERRGGTTPDKNSAVLLWQAIWPGELDSNSYSTFCKELGLKEVPDESTALVTLDSDELQRRLSVWLSGSVDSDIESAQVAKLIASASNHAWSADAIPPLAEWAEQNRRPLDLIVDASRRSEYYCPSPTLFDNQRDLLLETWIPGVANVHAATKSLAVRAMGRAGTGDIRGARQDVVAIMRLARLAYRAPSALEKSMALKVTDLGFTTAATLLQQRALEMDDAKSILDSLVEIPIYSGSVECIDGHERLMILDAVTALASGKSVYGDTFHRSEFLFLTIDWNILLRDANRWFDRLVAAGRSPSHELRRQAFDEIEADLLDLEGERDRHRGIAVLADRKLRSEIVSSIYVCSVLPAADRLIAAEELVNTRLQLTRLAAALAIYRTDQGEYPPDLSALVPAVLPQLPTDLYTGKPFAYHRTKDGYLLYGLGENHADDGGSHQLHNVLAGQSAADLNITDEELSKKIPPGADDHALRVPTPTFKLSAPAPEPTGDPP